MKSLHSNLKVNIFVIVNKPCEKTKTDSALVRLNNFDFLSVALSLKASSVSTEDINQVANILFHFFETSKIISLNGWALVFIERYSNKSK